MSRKESNALVVTENMRSIRDCIFTVRGVQVMVDWDLAALYGVETRVMNKAVKRNEDRFPERFRFRLSQSEMDELITNCDKSGRLKHYPGLPYVFTEQGIAMLASVLRSATAETLDLFAKKRKGVKVTVFTSEHYDKKHVPHRKISDADVKTFNAQYPKLAVCYNESFHDRFLIIDDKELYLIGASLKDLGKKCFAFTKLDAGEIRRVKKSVFGVSAR